MTLDGEATAYWQPKQWLLYDKPEKPPPPNTYGINYQPISKCLVRSVLRAMRLTLSKYGKVLAGECPSMTLELRLVSVARSY